MTESRSTRQRPARPAPERPAREETATAEKPSAPAEKPAERRCNLPGCEKTPEWRGLCPAHRQTHRGLANPKGRSGD